MKVITFFQQKRVDGGLRTGIAVDGETLFHSFEHAAAEPDPALLWYVDIFCRSSSLPKNPDEAKGWLLRHASVIADGLRQVADEIRAGIDADGWPFRRAVANAPKGVKIEIIASSARSLEARAITTVLRGLAARLERLLKNIEPLHAET